jgi:hypothetical protein
VMNNFAWSVIGDYALVRDSRTAAYSLRAEKNIW